MPSMSHEFLELACQLLILKHVSLDERDALIRGFQFRLGDVGHVRLRIAVVARPGRLTACRAAIRQDALERCG